MMYVFIAPEKKMIQTRKTRDRTTNGANHE